MIKLNVYKYIYSPGKTHLEVVKKFAHLHLSVFETMLEVLWKVLNFYRAISATAAVVTRLAKYEWFCSIGDFHS